MNHQHVHRRYPTCCSEETCKDDSVQYTATTESSTADGFSKQSLLKNDAHESSPNWEAQEVLFLDDSFCQSDCSKLTSDHGSSRFTDHDSSHCNGSDRSKSKSGYHVQDIPYEDSFCRHCEKDTWWTDGLSDSDDESLQSKDDNFFIPISRRGRSMTIEATPQRGRSLDVAIQKTSHSFHRVSRRSSDTSNMIDQISGKKPHKNNSGLHSKASSSHSTLRSSNGDLNHRQASHRQRSAADLSEFQKSLVKSKKNSHNQGMGAHPPLVTTQVDLHEDACQRRGPRQRSVEREHRRRSASIQKYDRSSDKNMIQRNSYYLSSPEQEIQKTFYESFEQSEKPQRRKSSTSQKNVHPLTARLLAERAIARQNSSAKLLSHSDSRHRCPETNFKHQENQKRSSKGKHQNVHPLTARISEQRNIGQKHHGKEPIRLEMKQSYAEVPTKQSSLSKLTSQVGKGNDLAERRHEALRPNLARQSSCPESPTRRAKTLQNLLPASNAEQCRVSLQIDERRRRLEKQHSCPESPSRRPRASQTTHSHSMRRMERKQSGGDLANSCSGHGGPPGANENRYGPVSSYFTRRDPTPVREFSDQLMIGETPDDSAFWHIEPDAFLSPSDQPVSLKSEHKNGKGSREPRHFI
jgi:hypothetical protein